MSAPDNMSKGLNVRELLEDLKRQPSSAYLLIDRSPVGLAPGTVGSYRGYYEDLAINVDESRGSTMTAGEFASLLEKSIGTEMTGYKGGTYEIRPSTRVWISNYGESSGARVTGVRFADWGAVYITWRRDDDE